MCHNSHIGWRDGPQTRWQFWELEAGHDITYVHIYGDGLSTIVFFRKTYSDFTDKWGIT